MSTTSALSRARTHAGAALESLGEAVGELVHDTAERASETAAELATSAAQLVDADAITAARRDLATRIDPDQPAARRWWWIGAGLLVTVASVIGWLVLSRRPQQVTLESAPPTEPPAAVDIEVESSTPAARNGQA